MTVRPSLNLSSLYISTKELVCWSDCWVTAHAVLIQSSMPGCYSCVLSDWKQRSLMSSVHGQTAMNQKWNKCDLFIHSHEWQLSQLIWPAIIPRHIHYGMPQPLAYPGIYQWAKSILPLLSLPFPSPPKLIPLSSFTSLPFLTSLSQASGSQAETTVKYVQVGYYSEKFSNTISQLVHFGDEPTTPKFPL